MKPSSTGPRAARKLEASAVALGMTPERPLPDKPDEMEWRDYLIMLLDFGAELEHSLMVQYLYAAYSLNDQTGPPAQRQKVAEWRNLILTVAKEEMGHLLTVQNLLCLVGGPVCFERSHFPADTPYLPFPFRLEPVSTKSLAWYVYAEAPEKWQTLLRSHSRKRHAQIEADIEMVAAIVGPDVLAGHTHTVGQLYARVLEIISDPTKIPDGDFRADTYAHQATWDDWGRGYAPPPARPGETKPPTEKVAERSNILIMPVATRTEAIAALIEVSGQGEAAHLKEKDDDEPTHFDRFRNLLEEFREFGEGWNVVHPVPTNPTTIAGPDQPEGTTSIEQSTSRKWATLFNLRYRALLTYLSHTFRLARLVDTQEPNVRGALMHKVFGEMYNLKALAGILVRRPLKDPSATDRAGTGGGPVACAAPPFEMPYSMDLPIDEPDCWRRHQDILRSALAIGRSLLAEHDAQREKLTAEEVAYLRTLQQLDQQSIDWMEVVMGGWVRKGGHPQ